MPAPALPTDQGSASFSFAEGTAFAFGGHEDTGAEEGWPSVRMALVQAMQEQFKVFHEQCSVRDREQFRRFERFGVDFLNDINTSVLSAQAAPSSVPDPLLKFNLAGCVAEPTEKQMPASRASTFNSHSSLRSTLQDSLQASGITSSKDSDSTTNATVMTSHVHRKHVNIHQLQSVRSKRKGLVKQLRSGSRIIALAESRVFMGSCAALILANSLFIGYEVDTAMNSALQRPPVENPEWFKVVNRFFCVAFALEIAIRIAAFRSDFFCSLDFKWNMFDVVMVISSLVEEGMDGMEGANMSSIRILRVLRLIRTFRIIRVVNVFRSLRLMVCCIFNSLLSLMWALVLLLLTMYLFSIVCVQGASGHLADLSLGATFSAPQGVAYGPVLGDAPGTRSGEIGLDPRSVLGSGDNLTDEQLWSQLDLQYRSVIRAVMTLLMCIAGGVDWYEAVRPLMTISPMYAVLFSAYVVLVLFGVLNVLTAVFVEHALKIRDRDLVVQAEMERTREFLKDMSELFKEADADSSGFLTRAEMDHYLQNERVSMYMATHQLDVSDVALMFRLLDVDETDSIEMDEFALGCFRLKGHARCLDVIRMFELMDVLQSEIATTRASVNALLGSMASSSDAEARLASRESGPGRLSGDAAAGEARNGPPIVSE